MPEVRLIDETGQQVGVIATDKAIEMARTKYLDVVEVSPNSRPPVCRIMDFGKFKYDHKKKSQKSRKKQHQVKLKEIRMGPKIDSHDLEVKTRTARRFLEEGSKVQFNVVFRGREIMYRDLGMQHLKSIITALEDVSKAEKEPRMEGYKINMILIPVKKRTGASDVKDEDEQDDGEKVQSDQRGETPPPPVREEPPADVKEP